MDKEVKMLETENCREIARWPVDTPRKLTFSAHGAIVAWLDSKQCFVCDVQTGDVLLRKHYVREDQDPEDSRDTICLSPKGQFVVSLRAGIELTVWNVRNQVRCTSMSLMLHDPKRKLYARQQISMIFSPDDSFFLVLKFRPGTSSGQELLIWDTAPWTTPQFLLIRLHGPVKKHLTITSSGLCAAFCEQYQGTRASGYIKLWNVIKPSKTN
jgi:hypothetical protein